VGHQRVPQSVLPEEDRLRVLPGVREPDRLAGVPLRIEVIGLVIETLPFLPRPHLVGVLPPGNRRQPEQGPGRQHQENRPQASTTSLIHHREFSRSARARLQLASILIQICILCQCHVQRDDATRITPFSGSRGSEGARVFRKGKRRGNTSRRSCPRQGGRPSRARRRTWRPFGSFGQ
jgi:hypothetical protein